MPFSGPTQELAGVQTYPLFSQHVFNSSVLITGKLQLTKCIIYESSPLGASQKTKTSVFKSLLNAQSRIEQQVLVQSIVNGINYPPLTMRKVLPEERLLRVM